MKEPSRSGEAIQGIAGASSDSSSQPRNIVSYHAFTVETTGRLGLCDRRAVAFATCLSSPEKFEGIIWAFSSYEAFRLGLDLGAERSGNKGVGAGDAGRTTWGLGLRWWIGGFRGGFRKQKYLLSQKAGGWLQIFTSLHVRRWILIGRLRNRGIHLSIGFTKYAGNISREFDG